jgi:hypothetical protein
MPPMDAPTLMPALAPVERLLAPCTTGEVCVVLVVDDVDGDAVDYSEVSVLYIDVEENKE